MKAKKQGTKPSPRAHGRVQSAPTLCKFCSMPENRCRATIDTISAAGGLGFHLHGPSMHESDLGRVVGATRGHEIPIREGYFD